MHNLKTSNISRNFGRAATGYEKSARLQLRAAQELITQCENFSGRILDIGAGPGIISKLATWPNADIISLDLSSEMAALSQSYSPSIVANMQQLPVRSSSLDNVISSLSLQWSPDFEVALAEIHRVLKLKGRLAFTTFSPNSLKELKDAFNYLDADQHLMNFEPVMRIFAMLKKAGFDNLIFNSQKITYHYPDILAALKSIKNIGASYAYAKGKGIKTKRYFDKLENIYKGITGEQNISLKWEVLYIHAEKV